MSDLILTLYDTGPAVDEARGLLIAKGFTVEPTGTFDKKMRTQVYAFQKANGLKEDGIIGQAETWPALRSKTPSKAPTPPRLAKSLKVLRDQINKLAPNRDKTSDGWIGDDAHAARPSDHNLNKFGVVTALDVDHDPGHGADGQAFANALVASRDFRIKYIIWNKKIASSVTDPWVWRPYSGDNPHTAHIHVSVHNDPQTYDAEDLWVLDTTKQPDDPGDVIDNDFDIAVATEPKPKKTLSQALASIWEAFAKIFR